MQIKHNEDTNTYVVEDNGKVLLEADSIADLYSTAVNIMSAFSQPTVTSNITEEEHKLALDILMGRFKG